MASSELLSRVGRKKAPPPPSALILLFLGEHHPELERVLREHAYTVVVPATADQAVALCLHNRFHASLIDEGTLAEAEDWSVAQSLRMVRPSVPVLLLVKGAVTKEQPVPDGVDCLVSDADPSEIVNALQRCMRGTANTATG